MYSVVLMAALTTGASETGCWWSHGCHGCHGCNGNSGGCYGNCYGGTGCYGCYGSSGTYGSYGGCYGCYGGCYGYGSCNGGYGGYACYGSCHGCAGGAAAYPAPAAPTYEPPVPKPPAPAEKIPAPKKSTTTTGNTVDRAQVIVHLPADAKLFVDDHLMTTSSERRVFKTPALEAGQTYYYILKAEVVREGKTIAEDRRILVHAGEVVEANFADLEAAPVARNDAQARR